MGQLVLILEDLGRFGSFFKSGDFFQVGTQILQIWVISSHTQVEWVHFHGFKSGPEAIVYFCGGSFGEFCTYNKKKSTNRVILGRCGSSWVILNHLLSKVFSSLRFRIHRKLISFWLSKKWPTWPNTAWKIVIFRNAPKVTQNDYNRQ